MTYEITKRTNGEAEIQVTVSKDELRREAEKAALKLSLDLKIDGFRPGKAPYEIIKKHIDEMRIFGEAADFLVTKQLNEIIIKENLDIAGQPKINLEKLAPGNELIYQASFSLLPKIILPDFSKIKAEKREAEIDQEETDKTLKNLQKMRAKEILEKRPAERGDKAEIDYEVYVDEKIIEGGKAEKQNVVIGEAQMIPGFEDALIGLEAEQEKEFILNFPKNYPDNLSGKKAKFKVKMRAVYKLELPNLDDEFAQGLGRKNLEELKKQLEENLKLEASQKELGRQELQLLDNLVAASSFNFVPEKLVAEENETMFQEAKRNLENSGGKFDDYLKHLSKSEDEFRAGLADEANRRLKLRLIFRRLILDNKIKVEPSEIEAEILRQANIYSFNPEIVNKIKSDGYKSRLENMMLNRKVVEWLKDQVA